MTVADYLNQLAERQVKNNRKIYNKTELIRHLKSKGVEGTTEQEEAFAKYYMYSVLQSKIRYNY